VLEAYVHGGRKDLKAAEQALLRGLEREPDSQAAITLLAGLYSDQKDYDNALTRLDELLKRNPKSAAAWMQKGVIYQAKGENSKAKDAYERAIEADPKHGPSLNNLAFMLSEEPGKLEEAFALATRARQAAPANPAIADTLGWINYKRRAFLPARALFAEALETMDVAEIRYHLGITDYALNNEASARENLEIALKGNLDQKLRDDATTRLATLNFNPDTAQPAQLSQVEAAAKRDPSDYLALMRLGLAYRNQKAVEKAQTAFEAASRANPQTSVPLLQLVTLLTGRDNARAYEIARNARKLDPNNPSVALAYGSAALRQNDYQAALVALPEGLNAPEKTDQASYDLCVARYAMGQITPSLEGFQKLATGNGTATQAAKEALTLVKSSGQAPTERLSLAESRLKANPNDLLALVARGEIDEQQGKFKEAAERFGKAVQLSPEFWPAHRRLAYLYSEHLKDDSLALQHATKARQAVPEDAVVAHVLGKVSFRKNDFANALRYFQEVARVTTTSGEPQYWVGVTSLRLQRTNDSKVALTKALELPLAPEMAQDARKVLTTLK
jgi:tetratricopeptide (TPR) repeat protein